MAGSPAVLWSRSLHMAAAATTLAAAGDVLVVAERWSRLAGLDPAGGAVRWERRIEDCWGVTVVAGDRVLHLTQAGVLRCLELATGRPLWMVEDLSFGHYVSVAGPVVVTGGWRGYRPLTRLALADGAPLGGFDWEPAAPAWPLPLPGGRVLVAGADDPVLRLLDAGSGAQLGRWRLPAPMLFPDAGVAFRTADDGRVVFLVGDRTVAAFSPAAGVEVLWEHGRPLPHPPVLSGGVLWLAEPDRVTVVDRGRPTEVTGLPQGVAAATVPVPGGALVPRAGGNLVLLDPAGVVRGRVRVPARVERVAGAGPLVHAIGKGHLTAVDVSPGDPSAG